MVCPLCKNCHNGSSDIRSIEVNFRWNQVKNQWDMMFIDGTFVNEFYNCENFQQFFKDLDKEKDNRYVICNRKQ